MELYFSDTEGFDKLKCCNDMENLYGEEIPHKSLVKIKIGNSSYYYDLKDLFIIVAKTIDQNEKPREIYTNTLFSNEQIKQIHNNFIVSKTVDKNGYKIFSNDIVRYIGEPFQLKNTWLMEGNFVKILWVLPMYNYELETAVDEIIIDENNYEYGQGNNYRVLPFYTYEERLCTLNPVSIYVYCKVIANGEQIAIPSNFLEKYGEII